MPDGCMRPYERDPHNVTARPVDWPSLSMQRKACHACAWRLHDAACLLVRAMARAHSCSLWFSTPADAALHQGAHRGAVPMAVPCLQVQICCAAARRGPCLPHRLHLCALRPLRMQQPPCSAAYTPPLSLLPSGFRAGDAHALHAGLVITWERAAIAKAERLPALAGMSLQAACRRFPAGRSRHLGAAVSALSTGQR